MRSMDELILCVDRGVKFLDNARPDWRGKINTAILDLGNTQDCILGQVYGDYFETILVLFDDCADEGEEAIYYGFQARSDREDAFCYPDEARALTALWKEAIG